MLRKLLKLYTMVMVPLKLDEYRITSNSTGPLCLDTGGGKDIAEKIQSPFRKGAISALKD